MLRRDFLRRTAGTIGAAWMGRGVGRAASLVPGDEPALPQRFQAHDEVVLGKTGIRTSRLAMGTGTIGGGRAVRTRRGWGQPVCEAAGGWVQREWAAVL